MLDIEIDYQVGIEDYLVLIKYQVMAGINPSINDSIRLWRRFCFVILVVAMPFIYGFIFQSVAWALAFLGVGLLIFMAMTYKNNLTKLWWRSYRKKCRYDLTMMHFKNNPSKIHRRLFSVKDNEISVSGSGRTISFSTDRIMVLLLDETYVYLFSKNYDAIIIPLEYVSVVQRLWFEEQAQKL